MTKQLAAFLAALQFLTRIRLSKRDTGATSFQESIVYFPLVGLILGLILAGAGQILSSLVPVPARAGFILFLGIFLSGGLHLDGFIDTMDGLLSGRERERVLEIMKDSRVGAHGVTAVITLLLLKFSLIFSLLSLSPGRLWLAGMPLSPFLLLMPVLARWAMVPAITCFPYARREGLGSLFGAGQGRKALLLATFSTMILSWLTLGYKGLILMFLIALAVWSWCSHIKGILGGLTGDTYGALAEITEVLVLVAGLFWPWLGV
ncbi:adenosylcobinamide-GDP ribazoletransferase [Moorella thermoacetica]|uniref:Adenosylcobinamide-GDP ribazoletransferase n=2 Tax=Neomoorella thermoacetica TaxID=1525 RepID=A0AAC9HH94_NEOTH|nr:adenosylcobinamide-GDP ribazoletransferase [Moorella thermoacetica]AOQ23783.1 Cobalamin synthase [Moorella thermoacetica]OIQ61694.1 cobalamin synthase [Moorella thermoacetica]TYL13968.1 Adenosylcobinamide-GDP ribazoletransferase [Moorella thermoacetica]GLI16093.1 adenosylcobinamide-GDP ribazoletransferase [Moorella thermoacetica]